MRYFVVFCSLFLLVASRAFSQDSVSLNTLVEKTVKQSSDRPLEKLYLQFDKPYYALGDTVWFKAYLTMEQNQPSALSKIVYIDVITDRDSVVQSLKLPAAEGVATGNFTLESLRYKQGNYRVRAYTQWMFNFKEDYFFYKNLLVGDAIEKTLATEANFKYMPGKSPKINTQIVFKDQDGRPYADKKVSWKLVSGFDQVSKGRGTTDFKGQLNISVDVDNADLTASALETDIQVNDLKSLNKSFPLMGVLPEKDVQFFPEGGSFVAGLPIRVAFKAIQSNGLGIDLKGTIRDGEGNRLVDFSSQHLGMGTVTFTPDAAKTYKADITFADGSTSTVALPEVKRSGICLSVNQRDTSSVSLRILANEAFLNANRNKGIYIVAQSGGRICYAAQMILQKQVFAADIDNDKFPLGITQISLLSSKGEPLSERLVFVYRPQKNPILVRPDKSVYAGRQKVKLNLSAQDLGAAAKGSYAISVINETKVPFDENQETTILSSLLLSSDLRGYIEKPNYYFIKTDQKKLADLDVLLLTQGYRGFSFPEIIAGKVPPLAFLPEQGITISGTLRMSNGMPVNKGNVRLIIPDKNFSASALTNPEGRFAFSNVFFSDSSKVTLSAVNNVNSKNMMFNTDGVAYPSIRRNINAADNVLNIDQYMAVYLENSKRQYFNSRTLQEVVIQGRQEKKLSHRDYPELTGLSMMPDREISGEMLKGCNVFLQCLQASSAGLTYADDNLYLTRTYNSGIKIPVQVFVRGMAVDVSYLNTLNPKEVESVEVFYKDDQSGINRRYNTYGIVVVNMREIKGVALRKDQLKELFPPSNVMTFTPQGYSKTKQFYLPKYQVAAGSMSQPDLRTTIYWNPQIGLENGKASMEFFTGDLKGSYKITLEGIDKEGNLSRSVSRFTLK